MPTQAAVPDPSPMPPSWLSLTHVVAHEGNANGSGVPVGTRVGALGVPASTLIDMSIFSDQEAAWEVQGFE